MFSLCVNSLFGTDYTWSLGLGLGTAVWNSGLNWSPLLSFPNGATDTATFGAGLNLANVITGTNNRTVKTLTFATNATTGFTIGQSGETLTLASAGSLINNNSNAASQRMAGSITAGGNISIINNAPYNLSAGLLVFQGTSGTTDFNVGSSSSVTTLFQGTNNIYINNGISGTGVTRLTGSGNVVVDMTGSAALVLTQTGSVYNNYTGATTVRGGELILNGLSGMSSTAIQLGDGSTTAAANIKLTYGSSTPTYTRNVQVNNTNPSGNAVIQTTASGVTKVASTFTLNRKACFSATLAGSTLQLQPTSVITGSGNVIIIGPGTVEFQGTNTYTGNTQINAGTLLLNNASGASINAGSITINATGTAQLGQANQIANGVGLILNGGTFNLNNFSPSSGSNTLGPLTLSASSAIDLGASATATTLKFSALSSFTTTQTLTINNYNVTDRITVTDLSNFNATNLAKINFTGYPNGARLEGNDVVPVPEPATIAVGLFAILSLIGSYCFRYAVKTA